MPLPFLLHTVRKLLELAHDQLDACIAVTPTSDLRSKLCDANIHLLSAIELVKELQA